jgi:hypothetical protein
LEAGGNFGSSIFYIFIRLVNNNMDNMDAFRGVFAEEGEREPTESKFSGGNYSRGYEVS